MKKIFRNAFILALLSYCSVYVYLSLNGQYKPSTIALEIDGSACLCSTDTSMWQPRQVIFATYENDLGANKMGYFFYPLVALDQKIWHKNVVTKSREMTKEELDAFTKHLIEREKADEKREHHYFEGDLNARNPDPQTK